MDFDCLRIGSALGDYHNNTFIVVNQKNVPVPYVWQTVSVDALES